MVIEVATFRLVGGADEEAFFAVDARWQEALMAEAAGFVRRTLAKRTGDEGGEWAVVTFWATIDHAHAAASAGRHGERDAFEALIDTATRVVRRYETID